MPVVALDGLNGEAKLSGHLGKEMEDRGEHLRLSAQRKSPRIMREIINHHQIVLVTRNTEYRGCPQITVYKIKQAICMRSGGRKRKFNMMP